MWGSAGRWLVRSGGVEGVLRWVEGEGKANGVMMGATASAGGGGAAMYTDLVEGVERAGWGYGVTRIERLVQGCSKSGPKIGSACRTREPFHAPVPVMFPIYFSKGK